MWLVLLFWCRYLLYELCVCSCTRLIASISTIQSYICVCNRFQLPYLTSESREKHIKEVHGMHRQLTQKIVSLLFDLILDSHFWSETIEMLKGDQANIHSMIGYLKMCAIMFNNLKPLWDCSFPIRTVYTVCWWCCCCIVGCVAILLFCGYAVAVVLTVFISSSFDLFFPLSLSRSLSLHSF